MSKYNVKELQKALEYASKTCAAEYVTIKIEELDRLVVQCGDISGNTIQITVYREDTQKMPTVTKTERL